MAGKKKTGKKLGKKDMKKTKGGILIGLNQPSITSPELTNFKYDLKQAPIGLNSFK